MKTELAELKQMALEEETLMVEEGGDMNTHILYYGPKAGSRAYAAHLTEALNRRILLKSLEN